MTRIAEQVRCQHIANVVLFVIALGIMLMFFIHPFESKHRGFFCDDENIRYPYHKDTVSVTILFITCAIPILVMVMVLEAVYGVLTQRCRCVGGSNPGEEESRFSGFKQGVTKGGWIVACLIYGNFLCFNVTEVFKLSFGRLRPSFLSACQPEVDVTSWPNCTGLFVTDVTCTNPDAHLVNDLRKSFLSGHASFVTINMLFIILYLQYRLPSSAPVLLKSPLQCIALGYGVFVCGSRIIDNMHHPQDVLAGVVLGLVFAWFTVYKICPRFMRSPPRMEEDMAPINPPPGNLSSKGHCPAIQSVSIKMEDNKNFSGKVGPEKE